MDDEWRLHCLPIAGQSRRIWRWILRTLAAGQRIQPGIGGGQQSRLEINLAHFDSRPEAPESQPGLPHFVDHKIGIDGIEIVFDTRAQDESVIDPVKIGARWVKRLVGEKCNSGSVLAENRKRVVKMELSVEVGNVWGPEFLGGRTRLRDPVGNLFEN